MQSTAWSKWKSDGTIGAQSTGHYVVFNDGDEVTLCGASIPDLYDAEFEGGAYVDCKRCQKKEETLNANGG